MSGLAEFELNLSNGLSANARKLFDQSEARTLREFSQSQLDQMSIY